MQIMGLFRCHHAWLLWWELIIVCFILTFRSQNTVVVSCINVPMSFVEENQLFDSQGGLGLIWSVQSFAIEVWMDFMPSHISKSAPKWLKGPSSTHALTATALGRRKRCCPVADHGNYSKGELGCNLPPYFAWNHLCSLEWLKPKIDCCILLNIHTVSS